MDQHASASGLVLSFIWIIHVAAREQQYTAKDADTIIDVCLLDYVTLECDPGQVIVVESARYGRMKANRCIGARNVGCVGDALGWLDRWCSGRQMCFIDEGFFVHLESYDCPLYQDKYLELSFKCVDVITPMSPMCSDIGLPAATLFESSGYLSSHVTRMTSCFQSPWVLVAPPDSIIVIELIDFSWALNRKPCDRNYAEIFNVAKETTTVLCRRNERRHDQIVLAASKLLIKLLPTPEGTEFLLHYKVLASGSERTGSLLSAGNLPTINTGIVVLVVFLYFMI